MLLIVEPNSKRHIRVEKKIRVTGKEAARDERDDGKRTDGKNVRRPDWPAPLREENSSVPVIINHKGGIKMTKVLVKKAKGIKKAQRWVDPMCTPFVR